MDHLSARTPPLHPASPVIFATNHLLQVLLPNRDFKKHKFIQAAPNTSVASSGTSMQYV
jgi:hypothetical protein